MNEGLLLVDRDRRVVYANARAEELIGRSLEQMRGIPCTDALNCPQCKCMCRLFDKGGAAAVEVTVFSQADGSRRVLRKNARLLCDEQGNLIGGVETFVDVTDELERREEAERYVSMLFQEKTRLEALLGAIDDGALTIDASMRVIVCSRRLAELVGMEAASLVGRPLWEVLGVPPQFLGAERARDLDGRHLQVVLRRGCERQPATVLFRPVRLSDDEMLAVVRPTDAPPRAAETRPRGDRFHGIISRSPAMWEVFRVIERAAQSDANILIEGESGVGKELVARAIHELSPRSEEPFYGVNCATFTGSLLLSELFGHERGSFTGAYRTTAGKLELAGAGTLFLDEVIEIPLHYQAALLRALEERSFERVGGRKRIDLRARIVAATNRRMCEAVQAGDFRKDLYFRLKVIPILVPPLRERPEDIPLLVDHFATFSAGMLGAKLIHFTEDALATMGRYAWPGNVRELRNTVEYLSFLDQDVIDASLLPPEIAGGAAPAGSHARFATGASAAAECDERAEILEALQRARFRKAKAARLLGIDRTTLWRKMKRFGI